jgi:hypothetical protein
MQSGTYRRTAAIRMDKAHGTRDGGNHGDHKQMMLIEGRPVSDGVGRRRTAARRLNGGLPGDSSAAGNGLDWRRT